MWLEAAATAAATTITRTTPIIMAVATATATTLDFSFDIVMQNDLQITSKARTLAWLKNSAAPSFVARHSWMCFGACGGGGVTKMYGFNGNLSALTWLQAKPKLNHSV